MAKKSNAKKAVRKANNTKRPAQKKSPVKNVESANKTGIIPMGDRILVRPLSAEDMGQTTSFGIIIPDTVDKKKSDQGTVMAVGPGKRNEHGERMAPDVQVGDHIYFSKPWDEPQKINGVEYYFIAESDILAVIKK